MTKSTPAPHGSDREEWYALPNDWWMRLRKLVREKWNYTLTGFFNDEKAKISERHIRRSKRSCRITEDSLRKLARGLGYNGDWQRLLTALGGNPSQLAGHHPSEGAFLPVSSPPNRLPKTLTLTAGSDTPQGADCRELQLWNRLKLIRCVVVTSAPYFRFGFKLFAPDGKLFGDGSIQSLGTNLVVHIARNNFNRPAHSSPRELFVTAYRNGVRAGPDQRLFEVPRTLHIPVELSMDDAGLVRLVVRSRCAYSTVVPAVIGHRLAILAWADHDEFELTVEDIEVECEK